jgi:hypothetical protein
LNMILSQTKLWIVFLLLFWLSFWLSAVCATKDKIPLCWSIPDWCTQFLKRYDCWTF